MSIRLGNSEIRDVLLDFDGVSIPKNKYGSNSEWWHRVHLSLMHELRKDANEETAERMVDKYVHISRRFGFRNAYFMMGGSFRSYDRISNRIDRAGVLNFDPQLTALIEKLSKHSRVSIFSGANLIPIHDSFEVLLGDQASLVEDHIYSADTMIFDKPQTLAYAEILLKLGIKPKHTVMVDDTLKEIKAANQVGIRTVWVNDGDTRNPYTPWAIPIIYELGNILDFT